MNSVLPNQMAVMGNFHGADAEGNPMPLGSLVATLDDTADCYIGLMGGGQLPVQLILVQKANQPEGTVKTVTVSFNGTSQDGTHLPAFDISFDLTGPNHPAQATQILVDVVTIRDTAFQTLPPDPGTATVTIL